MIKLTANNSKATFKIQGPKFVVEQEAVAIFKEMVEKDKEFARLMCLSMVTAQIEKEEIEKYLNNAFETKRIGDAMIEKMKNAKTKKEADKAVIDMLEEVLKGLGDKVEND